MVHIMISRRRGGSLYEQVAADIRAKILSGELAAGSALKSELYLAQEYKVGRDTVRDAMAILRNEGLIESSRGHPTRVRPLRARERVWLHAGETAIARMPTPEERNDHDIDDGVPVFVVNDTVFPGDRFEFFAQ
jgi:DNA-binding FadR family transcriptional regulator